MESNNKLKTKQRRRIKETNDDDVPFDLNGTQEKIPPPESILNEAIKLDFSQQDSGEVKLFHNKYEKFFNRSTPSNFLHVLAERSAPGGAETANDWPKERLCSFMKWILKNYSHFLTIKTASGVDSKDYPLHTAFSKKNYVFIEEVLSYPNIKNLREVLEQKTTRNQTYMHLTITSKSPVVELMAQKCKDLSINEAWRGSGDKKLTPLHVAVQEVHKLCEIVETYLSLDSNDSTRWDGERVLSHVMGALRGGLESASAAGNPMNKIDSIFGEWAKKNLSSGGENQVKPKAVADLLLELIRDHQESEGFGMSQVEVVRLLISLCDTVLSDKAEVKFAETENKATEEPQKEELTPYQMRLLELQGVWDDLIKFLEGENIKVSHKDRDGAFRRVIIEDPVADAIRSHCLHNFDRDRIAKCLYKPGDERDIDFDLSGLPNPTISNVFLKSLSNHLRFESILKYVALPKLALDEHENPNGENGDSSTSPVKRRAVADLRDVFDWLRKNGVRSIIITITVIDYGHPCHSDEAIEEALNGFHVENWDWKNPDLCANVIARSSNQIKSISLYSSGNNAVLMGWASSEGLLNKEKFPQLQKVRLFIQQGQESTERRNNNIKAFEKEVGSITLKIDNKEEPIKVEHRLDDGKVSYAAYFGTNNVTAHQEIPWISELEKFAIFLASEESIRARDTPIKIAIIDDGVDASLDIFAGKIATGRSFCPLGGSADLMNAYYVPSGHHGTMMADLICRICPSVQLYVARLDENTNRNDMSRQITVKSATEAIEWAVAFKVDIISMSWTLEGRAEASQQGKDLEGFKTAISAAESNQILMFCAASDQGSNATENCYPGKWNKCIKVGAATALGDKCTWVPSDQIEYLLPGKDIPFKRHTSDGFSAVQESGSSLATALASGLAGLLLCCDRLTYTGIETRLQGREKMSDAFRKLAGADKSEKAFVEAHKWFGHKFWRYVASNMNEADTNGVNSKAVVKPRPTEWAPEATKALLRIMNEIKVSLKID